MQLREAIFEIRNAEGERAVILAVEPFTPESSACVAHLTESYAVPADLGSTGFSYFLGRDEVQELHEWASRSNLAPERLVDLVCHFATHDAYPEWAREIGKV